MPLEHFPALIPFALAVFALQGLLMVVDEFVFHRNREMPRWERIGHPLDTLTVLAPLLLVLWLSPSATWKMLFLALAIFSCLFVTKDEWVHARTCSPAEQWLHSILFMVHPVLFIMVFLLWQAGATYWLSVQSVLVSVFLFWQIIYWNGPWASSRPTKTIP